MKYSIIPLAISAILSGTMYQAAAQQLTDSAGAFVAASKDALVWATDIEGSEGVYKMWYSEDDDKFKLRVLFIAVFEQASNFKLSARNLHISQAVSLCVSCDFIYLRAEKRFGIFLHYSIFIKGR